MVRVWLDSHASWFWWLRIMARNVGTGELIF
jgi:hypothetical protein